MTNAQVKTIIGALVAIGLVLAVSYGLISQQTADQIKAQADQTLSTGQPAPAPSGSAQPPAPQTPPPNGTTQPGATPPGPAPTPKP